MYPRKAGLLLCPAAVRTPPHSGIDFLNPGDMDPLYPISVLVTVEKNFGSSTAGTV